jgi:hypothetical protein
VTAPARPDARGAYGLCLAGVETVADLLVPAEPDWPRIELSATVGHASPAIQWVRRDSALLRLRAGGQVEVDWIRGRAEFTLPRRVTPADLLHPYLSSVAAVAAHRRGCEGFHAGALIANGGAWVVIGDKGAGKSSLLAMLALRGHPVVADDVAILDDEGRVLAGPRFIDLRAGASEELGAGEAIGVVGTRERYRMRIGEVPAATPLRGFVRLAWGEAAAVTSVRAARRLTELYANRIARLEPADATPILELSTLPMLELRRPRGWTKAGAAAEQLLDALPG